jgi:hypothetical protein
VSDDWEIFMCQMGDHPASIAVDVGISESIRELPTTCASVRLTYKTPNEHGLPTREEYAAVSALEDALLAFLDESPGDAFVGRVTTQGKRTFISYSRRGESEWDTMVRRLAADHGYALECVLEEDPEYKNYWNDLYPTADDWRVIYDERVIENARKHGDDGSRPRNIDHWVYFPSESAAQPFIEWAMSDRFTFEARYSGPGDDGRYCARLSHVGALTNRDVSSHTLALMRKAGEFGGDYDGWETPVLKPGDTE